MASRRLPEKHHSFLSRGCFHLEMSMKFAVVTACDEGYADLQELTSPTITAYCDLHGYDCYVHRIVEKERPAAWYKIKEVLKAFETGVEFVLWIDTDGIVVNNKFRLEDIAEDGKDFYFACNWAAMNSGVFMMRNTQLNKDFLNLVWQHDQFINDGWWEQRAIIHLLELQVYPEEKIKEIPAVDFNSEEYFSFSFIHHLPQVSKVERMKIFRKILSKGINGKIKQDKT